MNQIARTDDRTLAIENRINQQVSSAIAVGTGGISFQNAGEVMEYAKMMAVSGSAVPKHLRGQPGACLGIIDDAIRFQTSPYALARKSYFVNDNLAYEAQVLAGIVNAHAPLKRRPQIAYEGEGGERVCIVTGEFKDGAVRDYRSPAIGKITPKNSPLWKNDPDQQLAYYSLRGFARRHCPEILLGIYDVEEMRSIDHRDDEPRPSLHQRLTQARDISTEQPAQAREGFDADFVTRENDTLTQEPEIEHETSSAPTPSADDQGSGGAAAHDAAAPDLSTTSEPNSDDQGEPDAVKDDRGDQSASGSSGLSDADRDWLKQAARMMWAATGKGEQDTLAKALETVRADFTPEGISQAAKDKGSAIYKKCKLVCFGEADAADTLEHIAGIAGCEPREVVT